MAMHTNLERQDRLIMHRIGVSAGIISILCSVVVFSLDPFTINSIINPIHKTILALLVIYFLIVLTSFVLVIKKYKNNSQFNQIIYNNPSQNPIRKLALNSSLFLAFSGGIVSRIGSYNEHYLKQQGNLHDNISIFISFFLVTSWMILSIIQYFQVSNEGNSSDIDFGLSNE